MAGTEQDESGLDWWLKQAEVVTVLLIAVSVLFGLGLLFFGGQSPANTRAGKIIALIDEHWRGALILSVPLFYRTLSAAASRINLSFGQPPPGEVTKQPNPERSE